MDRDARTVSFARAVTVALDAPRAGGVIDTRGGSGVDSAASWGTITVCCIIPSP